MGIFGGKDDNKNKGRKGKGPKAMHRGGKKEMRRQREEEEITEAGPQGMAPQPKINLKDNKEIEYMPIADREQMTDEEYYDRGDYERSYGPQKYGAPKMKHPAQKRMSDMVAKVYGKPMAPSQQRNPTNAEKKQQYTTYGIPDNLYTESGEKINTANIDEGNLSAIHRVHKSGPYVNVQEATERFGGGTKLFLKNPMGPKKYGDPAMKYGHIAPSMNKPKKGGRAKAKVDMPKKPISGQRPK